MSKQCRVLKGGYCETTQGYSASHKANDLVGAGYTLDTIVAHSDGVIVEVVKNCNENTNGENGHRLAYIYGNYVKIKHDNGYYTLYAHGKYNTINVNVGDRVKKGQSLFYMGNTGYSFGGHVHFEIRNENDVKIDPTNYIDKDLPEVIKLPQAVEPNDKVNQVEVICGNSTLRCRTGHSTNDKIIGFIKEGYYNIISTYKDGQYNWFEVEKNKWIAGVDGCVKYHQLKEEPKSEENAKQNEPEITENFLKKFFKALINLIKNWLNS